MFRTVSNYFSSSILHEATFPHYLFNFFDTFIQLYSSLFHYIISYHIISYYIIHSSPMNCFIMISSTWVSHTLLTYYFSFCPIISHISPFRMSVFTGALRQPPQSVGLFSSRAPHRPNPIALSALVRTGWTCSYLNFTWLLLICHNSLFYTI